LKDYNPIYYLSTLEFIYNKYSPDLLFFGHTYETRDWVPRLSARLDIPFIADCINIKNNQNSISYTRQTYQGKLNNDIEANSKVLCSIQSGCYKADSIKDGNANIKTIQINTLDVPNIINTEKKFKEQQGGVDLSVAEKIISVGRGIGKKENLPLIQELKKLINAELGSSRPIVDYGWLSHDHQIGSSGQVVNPKLYFSLGISGAIQHQVGMKGSDCIMAINKDKNAPIFEIADYAIIGDLLEIVPKLIEKIKNN
jgi:electron transfer flavoprotein alpha subunit